MKIAIDLMGGDFAPETVIEGVKQYYFDKMKNSLPEKETLLLVGIKKNFAHSFFKDEVVFDNKNLFENNLFKIQRVICNNYIKMEEQPLTFFQNEEEDLDYTIIKCIQLVKNKEADICYSAGNSGAVIFTALNLLKLKNENKIPAIATFIPTINSDKNKACSILLDVGASGNKPIKAENLLNIAKLGIEFYKEYSSNKEYKYSIPKVGLLNIGSEGWKGSKEHRLVYEKLNIPSDEKNFSFIGNVEADKVVYTDADIIVADGFTGNIVLKLLESFKKLLGELLDRETDKSSDIASKFSYEGIGGAPLLGFDEKIVIGHGKSSAKAITGGILFCKKYIQQEQN